MAIRTGAGSSAVSWAALLEPRHALPAAALITGTLAPAFGLFITATVLPSVVAEIGGLGLYAWASTGYAVTSILGSAGSSVVVRRVGTRGTLLIAVAALVAGTCVCATAPAMAVLLAGRAVQGLGGGMMTAAVHGVVREVFPPALWPRMLATISAAWGIAAMSGPAVGGVFAGLGMWRGAFWVMLPLAVTAGLMTWVLLPPAPRRDDARAARVPMGRLALMCGSVLAVASVGNAGSVAARVALVAAAVAAMAVVLRVDRRATDRLFPADMLSLRREAGRGFWMVFFVATCTTPGGVYLPLLLQVLHGLPPAAAGYFYAGQSFSWTMAALVSVRLAGTRARGAVVVGPLMIATGFVGLHATIAAGPMGAIVAFVVLVGAGIGTCWAHLASIILGSAGHGEGAVAASLIPTTQTFAASLGAALCGIIANASGLSGAATPATAALAGERLFGFFLLSPLVAATIGVSLARAARAEVSARGDCA